MVEAALLVLRVSWNLLTTFWRRVSSAQPEPELKAYRRRKQFLTRTVDSLAQSKGRGCAWLTELSGPAPVEL